MSAPGGERASAQPRSLLDYPEAHRFALLADGEERRDKGLRMCGVRGIATSGPKPTWTRARSHGWDGRWCRSVQTGLWPLVARLYASLLAGRGLPKIARYQRGNRACGELWNNCTTGSRSPTIWWLELVNKMALPEWEFRVVVGRTRIDYDAGKEYANREKHGYSLESAVALLESMLLPFGAPPFMTSDGFIEAGEVRHMHMAVDDCGKVVLMVTTMRQDETVRVISFRRASAQEREQFHSSTGFLEAAVED